MDTFTNTDVDIAKLLMSAGFLKPHEFDKAYAGCRDNRRSLGTVLLEHRVIQPHHFVAASQVRREVEEGRLSSAEARTIVYLMGHCHMPLSEAMDQLGVIGKNPWKSSLDNLAKLDLGTRETDSETC